VRQRPDGNFEFLRRLDHQVKLRGFRIELEEISAVLRRHPGVKDAVPHSTSRVEATSVWRPTCRYARRFGKPEELREFLRATLPDYMVPTRLTFLDALPRLPNGKVDYRGLSEPEPGEAGDSPVPNDAVEGGRYLRGITGTSPAEHDTELV